MADLGCAHEYQAVIHWRGGARPFTNPDVSALTSVSWTRTVNDVSEASITISKSGAGDCCAQLGQIEPWVHELTLYRDSALVWQGPVARVTETRDTVTVEARDVLAWLERIVNTVQLRYTSAKPDADGRRAAPVQWIAEDLLRKNIGASPLSAPPDWCGVLDYIVRRDAPAITKFEKDGSDDASAWNAYLATIFDDELVSRGLEYTTVGRSILLRAPATDTDRPQARLFTEDIAGDLQVIRDGAAAATYAFATTQQPQNISPGLTVGTGKTGTPYGRLDWLVSSTAENADEDDLRAMARQALGGRYPAPTTISIPTGSQLAATAPVSIDQLVCGERIDAVTNTFCMEIAQAFRLSDVEATWSASTGSAGSEQVAVSLVPLSSVTNGPGGI